MPSLAQSLSRHDLGHLHIVAELWGLDLEAPDAHQGLKELTAAMLQPGLLLEIVSTLPPESQQALLQLARHRGRLPWDAFTRQYGPLRQMGPARRDRELPHLAPVSTTEVLFYHGLLGRDFIHTDEGLQEFAYLPDELLRLLEPHLPPAETADQEAPPPLGRPARPDEYARPRPSAPPILDDLTTLLAARRLGWENPPHPLTVSLPFLEALLHRLGALRDGQPDPASVKELLETPRPQALLRLTQTWLDSDLNDLCQTPGLRCAGTWQYNPQQARQRLLSWLQALPARTWWGLNAFIAGVHQHNPDLLRSGGAYDSWLLYRTADGAYLKGFEHWMDVEGAFLRYLIVGPLFWLGLTETAENETGQPTAFRLSPRAAALLSGQPADDLVAESPPLHVSSQGVILVPPQASLALRYQIARFGEWEQANRSGYRYRITPASLERAARQGLSSAHLLSLLQKHAAALPPALRTALIRWEKQGSPAARLQTVLLLRLASPEILAELKKSPAARFLGEQIGPTAILVQPAARKKILAALAELGWLTDDRSKGDE